MKIWCYIALSVILIYSSGCDRQSDVKDGLSYDEYINMALEYESKPDNEKAISAYRKALKIKPQDSNTHFALGELYAAEAQKSYIVATNKHLFERLTNQKTGRGKDQTKILKELGYKEEYKAFAIQEYKEAIKFDPTNWTARYSLATDHFNNKRYKEAIDEYNRLIVINPKYSNAFSLLGKSYLEVGFCNKALDSFEKAYKLDLDADSYHFEAGKVYMKMNNIVKLEEMLDKLSNSKYYREGLNRYFYKSHGEKCVDQ